MRHCYAGWNPSESGRKGSASGGVATLLAQAVLKEGGVYFGTRWDEEMHAVVAWTETDPEPFRGSRYVQARFGAEARQALERFVLSGRTVLFVGTPCQVASLKALRSHPNLICVDLLCHGTCPEEYLEQELKHLAKGETVTDVRFREGPRFRLSLWNGSRCLSKADAARSPYLWAYLSGISLREACYRCPFATPERAGDLTLGDFIGYSKPGVSFVLSHTEAGEALLQRCGAVLEERPLEERLGYRPGILEPSAPSPLRERFLQELEKADFPHAVRRTLRGYFRALPFRNAWKWLHHQAFLLKRRLGG